MSPYLRFELSERSTLWGLVGYGTGEMAMDRPFRVLHPGVPTPS